jgi:hypothetical protein
MQGADLTFEPTITVSALFTIGSSFFGVFFTCLFFVWTLRGRVDNLTNQMTVVASELTAVRKILEIQARQDERINSLEKRWDELRHGEGMVLPLMPARRQHV